MTRRSLALALAALAAGAPALCAQTADAFLLNGTEVQRLELPPGVAAERGFAVAPGGAIVLRTRDNLYDVGVGAPLLRAGEPALAGLVVNRAGALFVTAGDRLALYAEGTLVPLAMLPQAGLALALGDPGLVLYGADAAGRGVLLLYQGGITTRPLLQTPAPITAATIVGDRVVFASGGGIYMLTAGAPLRLLLPAAAAGAAVRSIAADPASGLIFFAAGSDVYALRRGTAQLVARNLGGSLQAAEGALYILDAAAPRLVRVSGIAAALPPDTAGSASHP